MINLYRTAKRVLYVEGNVDGTIGGSFFSLLFLARGLDREQFNPLVMFASPNSLIGAFRSAGIDTQVFARREPVRIAGVIGRLLSKLANFYLGFVGEPMRLAAFLRQERVALVHLNNSIVSNHIWMLASMWAGIPCISHERGINATHSRRARWLASRLDAIVCISEAVGDNLRQQNVVSQRIITVPNALDPADLSVHQSPDAVYKEFQIVGARRLIGVVGNIKAWKGQEVLIRALEKIRETCPEVVCLMIGDSSVHDRDYRQRIEKLAKDLGLEDRVIFTGYRSNVADYINALEILVHTSVLPEPFGRVVLEGMALRKPVIGTRCGGVPEIIDEGKTGLLYQPGNSEELAQCLRKLLSDNELRRSMGAAGYDRLVSQFGITKHVQAIERLYMNVLEGRTHAQSG